MSKAPRAPRSNSQPPSPASSKAARTTSVRTCPRCFLPEAHSGDCADRDTLGCPTPLDLPADAAVTFKCGPCKKVFTVPVQNIMQRKRLNQLGQCQGDRCHARVVQPAAIPSPTGPAPLGDLSDGQR